MRKFLILVFISGILMALAGCDYFPFGYTPIGEVVSSPGRFDGQEIKVRGEVTQISKLPLIDLKSYTLRDESGEILVLTDGPLPPLNERTAIRAQVKTMAIIDGQSFGLRLIELERLPVFGSGR